MCSLSTIDRGAEHGLRQRVRSSEAGTVKVEVNTKPEKDSEATWDDGNKTAPSHECGHAPAMTEDARDREEVKEEKSYLVHQ